MSYVSDQLDLCPIVFQVNCNLSRIVTRHGLISGMRSFVVRNALCCQLRYGHAVSYDILCGSRSSRRFKHNYYLTIDENFNSLASLIIEAITIRDGRGRVCSWIW